MFVIKCIKGKKSGQYYGIDRNSGGYPYFTTFESCQKFYTIEACEKYIDDFQKFSYLTDGVEMIVINELKESTKARYSVQESKNHE